MAGFHDIIGHEMVKEHLQKAIEYHKVSHAYILSGEEGMGRKTLAKAFAMTLLCEKSDKEPCMKCHSCRQILSGNHPDVIWTTHEKPSSIGVDDIRTQVNDTVQIKPYSSAYKLYIVNEAEKMTAQAQNALLKTIEEPPAYAVIILLTNNADLFLPTMLSRCITLNLKTVPDSVIHNFLMEKYQVPDYKADFCTAFAQGNVGKAIQLASSEDFNEIKTSALQLLKKIKELELHEMTETIKKISDYKLEINDYFDIMFIWYRDVLLYKATSDINSLIFKDEISDLKKQASKSSYEGIETIIKSLDKAKRRLNANVNFNLVMELLLQTIKEN